MKGAGAKLDVGLISQAFRVVIAVRGVPPMVCCESPELIREAVFMVFDIGSGDDDMIGE